MKKQLLLLALTLGTQVSAETLKDALGVQGEKYLQTINDAPINEFQKSKRAMVLKMLDRDISTVKTEELAGIAATLEDFANVVTPLLKQSKTSLSSEEFSTLVQQVKSQMEALAASRKKGPATAPRPGKAVLYLDPSLNQESDTDTMPKMLLLSDAGLNEDLDSTDEDQDARINSLMLNVIALNQMNNNEESDSDINADTVVHMYGDIFKQLIEDNEWSREEGISDEQNCKELLKLFFNALGLTANDYVSVLSAFTNALVSLQNEMNNQELALPVHQSLRGETPRQLPVPTLMVTDADREAAIIDATSTYINTLNTELEAMLNKYAGQQQPENSLAANLPPSDNIDDLLAAPPEELATLAQEIGATDDTPTQELNYEQVLAQAHKAILNSRISRASTDEEIAELTAQLLEELHAEAAQNGETIITPVSQDAVVSLPKKHRSQCKINYRKKNKAAAKIRKEQAKQSKEELIQKQEVYYTNTLPGGGRIISRFPINNASDRDTSRGLGAILDTPSAANTTL